ncbi:hypothetical protein ACVWW4_000349 [Bradyrhizobium sp. LB7.1]
MNPIKQLAHWLAPEYRIRNNKPVKFLLRYREAPKVLASIAWQRQVRETGILSCNRLARQRNEGSQRKVSAATAS